MKTPENIISGSADDVGPDDVTVSHVTQSIDESISRSKMAAPLNILGARFVRFLRQSATSSSSESRFPFGIL